MRSIVIYFLLLLGLMACAPRPFGMAHAPENAPPAFKKGFEDGCNTGLAGFGNSFYKSFYRFTKDFTYVNDQMYQNGWTKGYQYCRGYAMKWTFQEWDKP